MIDHSSLISDIMLVSVLSVVPLLIVFGNVMVLCVILGNSKLRSNVTNQLMASLAVADSLIGVVVTPVSLFSQVEFWEFGRSIT